jgi:hypothetical protein
MKVDEFVADIKEGKTFGPVLGGRVRYSIDYQHNHPSLLTIKLTFFAFYV